MLMCIKHLHITYFFRHSDMTNKFLDLQFNTMKYLFFMFLSIQHLFVIEKITVSFKKNRCKIHYWTVGVCLHRDITKAISESRAAIEQLAPPNTEKMAQLSKFENLDDCVYMQPITDSKLEY